MKRMDTLFHFTGNPRETWASCERRWQLHVATQKHRRALQCTWSPHAETRLSLSVLFTAIGWEKIGSSLCAQLLATVENCAPPIYPTHATAAWEYRNCTNPGEEWRTPTKDSEIKEIGLLGLNLMNPTSREYQSIVTLNAGLAISQHKPLYLLSKI